MDLTTIYVLIGKDSFSKNKYLYCWRLIYRGVFSGGLGAISRPLILATNTSLVRYWVPPLRLSPYYPEAAELVTYERALAGSTVVAAGSKSRRLMHCEMCGGPVRGPVVVVMGAVLAMSFSC